MTIEKAIVVENWVRTNIIGSFLYIAILAFSLGYKGFSPGHFFLLFLICLVLSHVVFIPKFVLIRYLVLESNGQNLNERQFLLRMIIALILSIFLTVGVLVFIFPKYHTTFYVSIGFSYLMPAIYLWYRSIFKPKKIIKVENDEIIDSEDLL